ncbi:MAG: hypothetical protein KHW66_05995 [Faecalibacterium prausnitzii]|uniref:Peptidase C39-like domain-containing protein n=1 Tax=Faecalibacterium prausnitzii TaxID=853 RepID=A0A943FXU0_9FIRM|nr:hypothetical protein [Faecalibacterium prausnitzii]
MALVLSLVLMAVMLPGALAVDLNVDAGFYFKQSRGGTCTLASAAMMLRRRAFLDGLTDWTDVTENSVRGSAWAGGLSHSFNYNAMQVGYSTLPSNNEAKKAVLIQLLAEHPEGIVLYDRRQPHAVLLTDYTDGVFYCSDPAGSVSSGRVPISAASISIAGASCYWYISSDHNSAVATLDSGTAASASGAVLSSVEAAILDANDQPVQSAEASPNVSSWSLKNFDSQLRFGELPEGSYTYMVVLTDSNGQTLCFMSDFTVSGSASSTATYWTVQDPSGTKLGQLVQETEEAVAEAVESEAEAVTETKKGMWSWLLG